MTAILGGLFETVATKPPGQPTISGFLLFFLKKQSPLILKINNKLFE